MNQLPELNRIGQSLWYDNIERRKLYDGSIKAMIDSGKIKGITSNPSIFQKSISNSSYYDVSLKPLAWSGLDAESIFWQLAVQDIRKAADLFSFLYKKTDGQDGYVSLEVNPLLAYDTNGTLKDASRLWNLVDKPNLMIKIPATSEGIPAVRRAIAMGINVNVTLIFSLERYAEVIEAYLGGLEDRINKGETIDLITSVASFFISRMDTKIDGYLDKELKDGKISSDEYGQLAGKAAIANAKLAYQLFEEKFNSERFKELKIQGAKVQRPLWASTSTKNPNYQDTLYLDELIAPDSVNTVPPATLEAFLDHGKAVTTIFNGVEEARNLFLELENKQISIHRVTQDLEREGVEAFSDAYKALIASVEQRRISAQAELGSLTSLIAKKINELEVVGFSERFFKKDPSLWTSDQKGQEEISVRMNWVSTPYEALKQIPGLSILPGEYLSKGFTHAVLLGMGGSSLAPEVINRIAAVKDEYSGKGLKLRILDSTDPDQVIVIEKEQPIDKTLFIVASKSGTTGEINAFLDYFWEKVKEINAGHPGEQFIAITDPGTKLAKISEERHFSRVFFADPQVGGRNSALTAFGLIPTALMGIDLEKFIGNAVDMADYCRDSGVLNENPGIVLGAIIGTAALAGRNKLTLITGEKWAAFGDWLEQLVAESSGKDGKGILPIANEPLIAAKDYSTDRLFVRIEQENENSTFTDALAQAGHPVITLHVDEVEGLAGQFYLWEIAVATACSIIGVNSFDQPDVQDAKIRTLAGLESYKNTGKLVEPTPFAEYPQARVLTQLDPSIERRGSLFRLIGSFIEKHLQQTEYLAINAFIPMNRENADVLQSFRRKLVEKYHLPVTLGFGPRYLHSTGQFHKGGPNTGLFIMLTAQRDNDLMIPGENVGFGVFQRAQAIGDLQALQAKGRRVLWLDLSAPDANILLKD